MPRNCSICTHLQRDEIDTSLLRGESLRNIAEQFGTSSTAVFRHKSGCVPVSLSKATEARTVVQADTLLQRLKDANQETVAILKDARNGGENETALRAIARIEKQLELEAKLLGELTDAPQINFNLTIINLQAVIIAALEPFPEARLAVAQALADSNL